MCDASLTLKFQFDLNWIPLGDRDERLYELYESLIRRYKQGIVRIVSHVYEKDSDGKLHLHAHIRLPKAYKSPSSEAWLSRYDIFKFKGFTVKVDRVGSLSGWQKYMLKDHGVDGKYFKTGVFLHANKEQEVCLHASATYRQCILNEIATLGAIEL
jgi:hypothetical protein